MLSVPCQIAAFNAARSVRQAVGGPSRAFALRRLVGGVNVVQALEFRLALEQLALTGEEEMLDLASPKLFAAYLAARRLVRSVEMTDLCDGRLPLFRELVPEAERGRVTHRLVDASKLDAAYRESSFDRVVSLTSFQHFAGDADREAMRQASRVLREGGLLFITVPYDRQFTEERYRVDSGDTRRRYDREALDDRLRAPGLERLSVTYYGERGIPIDSVLTDRYHPAVYAALNWLAPLLQPLFFVERPESEARGAALLFRKLPG